MLLTPLGPIVIFSNELEIAYSFQTLPNVTSHFPDVSSRFSIKINAFKETVTIRCVLENKSIIGHPETGENFEAISFYKEDFKLTIGVTADFLKQEGRLLENGIEIITTSPIEIGVCWIQPVTDANDVQTFFGADLFYK